jgi:hypothetical protein
MFEKAHGAMSVPLLFREQLVGLRFEDLDHEQRLSSGHLRLWRGVSETFAVLPLSVDAVAAVCDNYALCDPHLRSDAVRIVLERFHCLLRGDESPHVFVSAILEELAD